LIDDVENKGISFHKDAFIRGKINSFHRPLQSFLTRVFD